MQNFIKYLYELTKPSDLNQDIFFQSFVQALGSNYYSNSTHSTINKVINVSHKISKIAKTNISKNYKFSKVYEFLKENLKPEALEIKLKELNIPQNDINIYISSISILAYNIMVNDTCNTELKNIYSVFKKIAKGGVFNDKEPFGPYFTKIDQDYFINSIINKKSCLPPIDTTDYKKNVKDHYIKIKTILNPNTPLNFYDLYVEPGITFKNNEFRTQQMNEIKLSSLLKINKYLILQSSAGTGKTMTCKHLLFQACEKNSNYTPILFQCRTYDFEKDFTNNVYSEYSRFDTSISLNNFIEILKANKTLIILDGLDELKPEIRDNFEDKLNSFVLTYENVNLILTSRPINNGFIILNNFLVINLLSFTIDNAKKLCSNFSNQIISQENKNRFINLINYNENKYKNFWSNPLLLTLLINVFIKNNYMETNIYFLYQQLYETMTRSHNYINQCTSSTLTYTKVNKHIFEHLLVKFCLLTYKDGMYSLTEEQFSSYFEMAKKKEDICFTYHDFLNDLITNLSFIYCDNYKYNFTHRSFQEFFAAKCLENQDDKHYRGIINELFNVKNRTTSESKVLDFLIENNKSRFEQNIFLPYLETFFSNDINYTYESFLLRNFNRLQYSSFNKSIFILSQHSCIFYFLSNYLNLSFIDETIYPQYNEIVIDTSSSQIRDEYDFKYKIGSSKINPKNYSDEELKDLYEKTYGKNYCVYIETILNDEKFNELKELLFNIEHPYYKIYNSLINYYRKLKKDSISYNNDLFKTLR